MNAIKPDSVFVIYIAAAPERLWQALTEPDLTEQYFFGRRIELGDGVGGKFRLWMKDGRLDTSGEILEWEPPRRLFVSWHVEWLEEFRALPSARILFVIEPLGGMVRLTVSEFHPQPPNEKGLEGGRKGWPLILSSLKSLLETGKALPMPG